MIYKLNSKDMKKLLLEFSSTVYGKTMFLMCFASFFITFASTILATIFFLKVKNFFSASFVIISAFISVISFTMGSYGYYKELRIYASKK